jgi:hypothetical protein
LAVGVAVAVGVVVGVAVAVGVGVAVVVGVVVGVAVGVAVGSWIKMSESSMVEVKPSEIQREAASILDVIARARSAVRA